MSKKYDTIHKTKESLQKEKQNTFKTTNMTGELDKLQKVGDKSWKKNNKEYDKQAREFERCKSNEQINKFKTPEKEKYKLLKETKKSKNKSPERSLDIRKKITEDNKNQTRKTYNSRILKRCPNEYSGTIKYCACYDTESPRENSKSVLLVNLNMLGDHNLLENIRRHVKSCSPVRNECSYYSISDCDSCEASSNESFRNEPLKTTIGHDEKDKGNIIQFHDPPRKYENINETEKDRSDKNIRRSPRPEKKMINNPKYTKAVNPHTSLDIMPSSESDTHSNIYKEVKQNNTKIEKLNNHNKNINDYKITNDDKTTEITNIHKELEQLKHRMDEITKEMNGTKIPFNSDNYINKERFEKNMKLDREVIEARINKVSDTIMKELNGVRTHLENIEKRQTQENESIEVFNESLKEKMKQVENNIEKKEITVNERSLNFTNHINNYKQSIEDHCNKLTATLDTWFEKKKKKIEEKENSIFEEVFKRMINKMKEEFEERIERLNKELNKYEKKLIPHDMISPRYSDDKKEVNRNTKAPTAYDTNKLHEDFNKPMYESITKGHNVIYDKNNGHIQEKIALYDNRIKHTQDIKQALQSIDYDRTHLNNSNPIKSYSSKNSPSVYPQISNERNERETNSYDFDYKTRNQNYGNRESRNNQNFGNRQREDYSSKAYIEQMKPINVNHTHKQEKSNNSDPEQINGLQFSEEDNNTIMNKDINSNDLNVCKYIDKRKRFICYEDTSRYKDDDDDYGEFDTNKIYSKNYTNLHEKERNYKNILNIQNATHPTEAIRHEIRSNTQKRTQRNS